MRQDRKRWSPEHERHVYWVEKAFAGFLLVVALAGVPLTSGVAQYFFVGIGSVGAFKMFPSIRPMISWVVERLPFLADKRPDPIPVKTMEMDAFEPKDDG